MNLQENIQRIKQLIEQEEPVRGKCGISRACDKEEKQASKDARAADKESERLIRADQKFAEKQNKENLDLDYDYFNNKRSKQDRDLVRKEFQNFKNTPSFRGNSSYKDEQKFAILYKVFENMKRRPNVAYALRLKQKFSIPNPQQVTLNQLSDIANQMGWDKFIQWYQAGGPEIK